MKTSKKNMFGFAHHAVLGLIVVGLVSAIGVKVLGGIHAQTPVYVIEGYVTHNGSNVAGAMVTHYGVPPTSQYAGFSVKSDGKGWYHFNVKPNATYRIFASKCIGGKSLSSADSKFRTGSTGGTIRKDLDLNQNGGCNP